MKILSWNVNGYRAAWKKGFDDWIGREQPDILCIQETKAWAEQLTEAQLNPHNYSVNFSQPDRKGYSGVATFSNSAPDSVALGYGIEKFDAEGRVLITEHNGVVLANIYFPNGKQNKTRLEYKMDFYEVTSEYFSKLLNSGKDVIVTGDYNTAHKPVDLSRPKANEKTSGFLPEERAWIDSWIELGFVDIFRKFNDKPEQYTWWDMRTGARERNVGWRIDYFFVSESLIERTSDAWLMPDVMGSDHCPLAIELKV